MRRFVVKILFFVSMLAVAMVAVSLSLPIIRFNTDPFDYYVRQLSLLKMPSENPRIVLVGGSNLSCGVDNALLGSLLHNEYAIVNLGYNAGLGVGLHFDMIWDYLRPGDIVVLAVEYTNFTRQGWNGGVPAMVFRCDVIGRNLLFSTLGDRWSDASIDVWRQYIIDKLRKLTQAPPPPHTHTRKNKHTRQHTNIGWFV